METSVLLFSLCLLLAGVWLVITINNDFKEKSRQVPRIPNTPHRQPQIANHVASGVRRVAENSARHRLNQPPAVAIASNKIAVVADQWQNLNTSLIRQMFEEYTRDS